MRVAGARVSVPLYLTEHVRSLGTFGCLMLGQPWLSIAPRGNGQPVIVMPGLAAGDFSTAPLPGYLRGLGVNVGPTRRVLSGVRDLGAVQILKEWSVARGVSLTPANRGDVSTS